MTRTIPLVAGLLLSGCLGVEPEFESDTPLLGDRVPEGALREDSALRGSAVTCPRYPTDGLGWEEGTIAPDFTVPGNGPGDEWSLTDFWCMAHGDGATVAIVLVHFTSCGICMSVAGPELETWQEQYSDRGLVVVGATVTGESFETVRTYWEDTLGHPHPWMADPTFSIARFFQGSSIGSPAYVVLDLSTMEIAHVQQGYSGEEELLFEPYLRP